MTTVMATIKCPEPECDTEWPAATPTEVLIRLLDIHSASAHAASVHTPAPTTSTAAKAEKVWHTIVSAAETSEAWAYFVWRWTGYKQATRLTGPDVVLQVVRVL